MLLYLDLNCFNRPFDNQDQQRVAFETAAVFSILQRLVEGWTIWPGRRLWISRTPSTHCPIAGQRSAVGAGVHRSESKLTSRWRREQRDSTPPVLDLWMPLISLAPRRVSVVVWSPVTIGSSGELAGRTPRSW